MCFADDTARRLNFLQETELPVARHTVILDASFVYDSLRVELIEQIVKLGKAVGEFDSEGGEQGKTFAVVSAFQPFFGVFFAECAWISDLDAKFFSDQENDICLFFSLLKIFARLLFGMRSFFVEFGNK